MNETMIDADMFTCNFLFYREEKEATGELQTGYVQLIPDVEYFPEHTEVLFSHVGKHRFD